MITFEQLERRARIWWQSERPDPTQPFQTLVAYNSFEFKACRHFCTMRHKRPICCRCIKDNKAMRKCQVCRHVLRWRKS